MEASCECEGDPAWLEIFWPDQPTADYQKHFQYNAADGGWAKYGDIPVTAIAYGNQELTKAAFSRPKVVFAFFHRVLSGTSIDLWENA